MPPASTATVPVRERWPGARRRRCRGRGRRRRRSRASPRSRGEDAASCCWPAAEALRAPTMATVRCEVEIVAADDREQRRGAGDVVEQRRVVGLARGDEPAAELVERGDLVFGFGDARARGRRRRRAWRGRAGPRSRLRPSRSRLSSWRKVCGPTLSVRMRPQPGDALRRAEDVARRRRPSASGSAASFRADLGLGAVPAAGAMLARWLKMRSSESTQAAVAATAMPSGAQPIRKAT